MKTSGDLFNEILMRYGELEIPYSEVCRTCRIKNAKDCFFSKPLSIWHIGENFIQEEKNVLFVGKVARGNPWDDRNNDIIDGRACAEDLLKQDKWPFWAYTHEIAKKVYGSDNNPWESIALTNMMKCNNSETTDKTTTHMKKSCLDELGVIWSEIEVLQPKVLIFYTHWGYDHQIENYRVQEGFENVTSRSRQVECGNQKLPWWVMKHDDGRVMLRTGHPERKKRDEFVRLISEFIGTVN